MENLIKLNSVLLIENNEIDIFIVSRVLQEMNVNTITACRSVNEALTHLLIPTNTYQLIIVNLNLPVASGLDFIKSFCIQPAYISGSSKVILVSAFFSPVDIQNAINYNIEMVTKPLTIENLNMIFA